jgi:N-acetylgalactosamine kinase
MSQAVSTYINRVDYTQEELESKLGGSLYDILKDIPSHELVITKNQHFRIHEAAKHICD